MEKAFKVVKTFLMTSLVVAALIFLAYGCLFDRGQGKVDEAKMSHAARGFADCVCETGQHGATRYCLHNIRPVTYRGHRPRLRTELDAQGLCTEYSDAWYDAKGGQWGRFIDWLNPLD